MNRSSSISSVLSCTLPPPPSASNEADSSDVAKIKSKLASLADVHELLEEPVEEVGGERIVWDYHNVVLERVPGYGFGIAVSGGRDNPHFTNGDPSIAISDVLKAGPAEAKLMINDRVISANGISLEGVDYATAVQVLRDSGQTVSLVVKRRVVLPPTIPASAVTSAEAKNIRVCLTRNKKKEDFGVVLGCKIYVKEICSRTVAEKDGSLQEGDLVSKINGTSAEGLTLKEARKLVETAKDKLELIVKRGGSSRDKSPTGKPVGFNGDLSKHVYSPQNIYVRETGQEDKNNLNRVYSIESNGPSSNPPRPPPPKENDELSSTARLNSAPTTDDLDRPKANLPDPRFISFQKNGSVGIRLTGGNEVGIFVTAVQPGSPAAQQGLQPGDKILKVNDMDMKGVTREEAVLFLLSLQDQINLIAQYRRDEYDQIVSLQRGDSFYIKAHFNYEEPEKGEMSFHKSDVFHVVDTLHNGVVGSWQVFRMDPFLSGLGRAAEQVQKGVIPNKARAEELATQQFNAAKKEQNALEQSRGTSFFRRKRDKTSHQRRSKSLGKDHWEDLVWSESMSKFPAYERVSLRHPGFPRPVVIFGPVADLARERLLRDYPGKFASPQLDPSEAKTTSGGGKNTTSKSGIVRLSSIRDLMNMGKHSLLDVTPNAVDKLNYAQFYPIVILTKADSKQIVKEVRAGIPKKAHLSSKKLLEQCQKLEKLWSHIFTATLNLNNITTESQWYTKLIDLIDKQQTAPIWISESKPDQSFSDDFLFPMTSRLSYASSPESDGEFCDPDPTPSSRSMSRNPSLVQDRSSPGITRSTSDPNLARDELVADPDGVIPNYNAPPPYGGVQTSMDVPDTSKRRSQGGDSKYGFSLTSHPSSRSIAASSADPPASTNRGSMDDLPLPPHPVHAVNPDSLLNQKTPRTSVGNGQSGTPGSAGSSSSAESGAKSQLLRTDPPNVPPKIDRQKKPSRHSVRTEFEQGNSLERSSHIRDLKMSAYDSYDPYATSTVDASLTLGSRPRSMGGGGGGGIVNGASAAYYDPSSSSSLATRPPRETRALSQDPASGYRSTRQLYGSVNGHDSSPNSKYSSPPGQSDPRYCYPDYKPVPPPKCAIYKPVPPPKPKSSYSSVPMSASNGIGSNGQRGSVPVMGIQQQTLNSNGYHEGNYINSVPMTNGYGNSTSHYHNHNGLMEATFAHKSSSAYVRSHDDADSGQGSSLDRDYNGGYGSTKPVNHSRGQYYYNVPPQPAASATTSAGPSPRKSGDGLDLSNREYRGSAFELYKKPMSEARTMPAAGNASQHYYNHPQIGR